MTSSQTPHNGLHMSASKSPNRKLPRERWRLMEVLKFLCFNDPSSDRDPEFAADLDARLKRLLSWLRTGKLKAYGRLDGDESRGADLARPFRPIEAEWWQTEVCQGCVDERTVLEHRVCRRR